MGSFSRSHAPNREQQERRKTPATQQPATHSNMGGGELHFIPTQGGVAPASPQAPEMAATCNLEPCSISTPCTAEPSKSDVPVQQRAPESILTCSEDAQKSRTDGFCWPRRLQRTLSLTAPEIAAAIRGETGKPATDQTAFSATFTLPSCFGSSEHDSPLLKL